MTKDFTFFCENREIDYIVRTDGKTVEWIKEESHSDDTPKFDAEETEKYDNFVNDIINHYVLGGWNILSAEADQNGDTMFIAIDFEGGQASRVSSIVPPEYYAELVSKYKIISLNVIAPENSDHEGSILIQTYC